MNTAVFFINALACAVNIPLYVEFGREINLGAAIMSGLVALYAAVTA